MLDPTYTWLARGTLAAVFLAAALHKLHAGLAFRAVVEDYRLLPAWAVPVSARALPALELAVALGLFVPALAREATLAAIALLALYSAAIGWNLARGRREIDCGCGGREHQPLCGALVARNAGLVLLGAAALLPSTARTWVWIDALTLAAGVAALWLLYTATNLAIAQATPRSASIHPSSTATRLPELEGT